MSDPHTVEAERPPSAADALAIIEREQARTGARLTPNLALFYGVWGAAWLTAGVLYFVRQLERLDGGTTAVVSVAVGVVAMVVSIVTSVRSSRGVRGASELRGTLYGMSWTIAMIGMGLLVSASAAAMPEELRGTLIPALFVFLVGVLYLAGGAVWSDRLQYGLGVWIATVAVGSVFAGQPANSLVLGIGGGGAFLAVAAWYAASGRTR